MLKSPRARAALQCWENRRLLRWRLAAIAASGLSAWLLLHPAAHGASEAAACADSPEATARTHTRALAHTSHALVPADFAARIAAVRAATTQGMRCNALMALGSDDANAEVVALIDDYARDGTFPAVQRCALDTLSGIPDPSASDCLAALLDQPDEALRLSALRALGRREDEAAHAALLAATRTPDLELRAHAAAALSVHHASEALPIMLPLLHKVAGASQIALIDALGLSKSPTAVEPLAGLLAQGMSEVRTSAIQALAALGSSDAARALVAAYPDARARDVYMMASALSQVDQPLARDALVKFAEQGAGEQSLAALRALGGVEDERVQALMQRALRGGDEARASAAADYMLQYGSPALLPELLEIARTGSPRRAQTLVSVIANIGGSEARATLVRMVREGGTAANAALVHLSQQEGAGREVRGLALEALQKGGQTGHLALSVLANDGSSEARDALIDVANGKSALAGQAMYSLAQRGDRQAVEALEQLVVRGRTPAQQASALAALAGEGQARKLPMLNNALKSPSAQLREQAVSALSVLGGPDAERAILSATHDPAPQVAHAALSALGSLGTPAALDRLSSLARQGDSDLAQAALMQVAELDAPRGAKLATQLAQSASPNARLAAVYAAAHLPAADGAKIVLDAAKSNDPSLMAAALAQTNELPSQLAADALSSMLQNAQAPRETRVQAGLLLSNLGGELAQKHAALIAQFAEEATE